MSDRAGRAKFQIDVVVVRIVVVRIKYNPAPVLGPWFLAGAPSKLSIFLCNDFQLFERLKLSAGLRAYPPYCPHRTVACPHHVSSWWESDFGASRNVVLPRFFLAHRLGRPLERFRNSLGLPMGAFRLRTRLKQNLE